MVPDLVTIVLLAGEDVVFVANDWHTALIPCYLKSLYRPDGIYKNAKVNFHCSVSDYIT